MPFLRLLVLLMTLIASIGATHAHAADDVVSISVADSGPCDSGAVDEADEDDDDDDDESHRPASGQWSTRVGERAGSGATHSDRHDQHRATPGSPPPRG